MWVGEEDETHDDVDESIEDVDPTTTTMRKAQIAARAQVSLKDLQNSTLTSIRLQNLTGFQTQSQYQQL